MPPSCALLGGFAIGVRVALLWQHYGNAWQSPAVIRQATARRTHAAHAYYACRRRLPSPAIKSTRLLRAPFHFVHTAGVLQREREMLASYCLVLCFIDRWAPLRLCDKGFSILRIAVATGKQ